MMYVSELCFYVILIGFCLSRFSYSRILVRHHWLVVGIVVLGAVILTTIGILFTDLPDFSDPRKVRLKP